MESKQAILGVLRRNLPPRVDRSPLDDGGWVRYEDRTSRFCEAVEAAGGQCLVVRGAAQLQERLRELPAYAQAKKICSRVPDAGPSHVDLDAVADPHELEDVDLAVLPGEFGVAENGAVWLTDNALKHRVICFIPQHVVLVIAAGAEPEDAIVDNMRQAYQRITFAGPGFGLFVSGPSKTADIEQSLVIGAHGPRSLTVFLLADGE